MNSPGEIIARARALLGARFRPQGRDPAVGLDCIGVLLCAFDIPVGQIPRAYRLRGRERDRLEAELLKRFRRVSRAEKRPGDVLLCAPAADQLHLAVDCGGSFIHADAKLRRVVETPGEPTWPIIAVFRRRSRRSRRS